MSLLSNAIAIPTASTGYNLTDSVRFRRSASARLTRTFASTGTNNKIQTFSAWVKRGNLSSAGTYRLMGGYDGSSTNSTEINFVNDQLRIEFGGSASNSLVTTARYRDPSAWYHIVVAIDTTQATSSNRIKMYVNGSQITAFDTANYPAQNAVSQLTSANANNNIGAGWGGFDYFDGYMTEVNFVDGQQLTPSDFGEYDDTTGVWKPKRYTGSHGTNGFYLPMKATTQASGFNTVLYKGNSGTQTIDVGFQPDFVWIKNRTNANNHLLVDSVRGVDKTLESNTTSAETTSTTNVSSFDADGFTLGSGANASNNSSYNYVAWCWEAGGTAVANTDGDIASQVSANTDKGFSVVTWTGNGSASQTVGHGLGTTPVISIRKMRDATSDWFVHTTLVDGSMDYLKLNLTNAVANSSLSAFTSTTIPVDANTNQYVAYCFASKAGYSKIGSYTGNGSTSGPTITTGFRPAFVMVKRTDAGADWVMFDNTRDPDNVADTYLFANNTDVENTANYCNFTNTGFDITTTSTFGNASGGSYIYMAFADTRNNQFNFDASGNKNNFTPVNINSNASSETSYDMMSDVPTLTDEDTSNFATWNPLVRPYSSTYGYTDLAGVLTEGNLKAAPSSSNNTCALSTIGFTSGKYYAEFTAGGNASAYYPVIGIVYDNTKTTLYDGGTGYQAPNGYKRINGTATAYGSSWTGGDVIGVAVDADANNITFYKNNVSQGAIAFTPVDEIRFAWWCANAFGAQMYANFGQRPFAYTPPTGYKKLNTYNLPDSAVVDGSQYFNTVLYNGTGTSNTIDTGMYNDFTWLKMRSSNSSHYLWNAIRGFSNTKALDTRTTGAEGHNSAYYTVSRKGDNQGFIINDVSPGNEVNSVGNTYVAWNWRANDGSSGVTNTDGSVTSTVSVNTTAGFSISTFPASGTFSIGHGLGVQPDVLFLKSYSTADGWVCWFRDPDGVPTRNARYFHATTGTATSGSNWLTTADASVYQFVTGQFFSAGNFVAFSWAEVEGYSRFGKYIGNASGDGPFVYTGFRPAFVMTKCTSTTGNWMITDIARNTYNVADLIIQPNNNNIEYSQDDIDILSNGFKMRDTVANRNASGATFVYMAFAENPFKNSLAR